MKVMYKPYLSGDNNMFMLKFDRLSTSLSVKCPLYKDVSTDTCRLKESCLLMDQKKIRR